MNTQKVSLHILFLFPLLHSINSLDTLGPNDTMKYGDVLISQGRKFALGFFGPGNSSLRYVGIWYYGLPEQTVVWVANRENPVNDTSGVVAFDHYGNLVIRENNRSFPILSVNVSSMTLNNSTTAQLLDSGNLVLNHGLSKVVIWRSFDYPTDTFLPSMKLGLDRRTGLNWILTSWKSRDDPTPGSYSCRFEPIGYPQLFLYQDLALYRRSGPLIEKLQGGDPSMPNTTTIVRNAMEVSLMYGISIISRYVVQESGSLKHFVWHNEQQQWTEVFFHPKEQCDYFSKCGPNGICGANNADQFDCTCLPGLEPKSPGHWHLWDGTGGCKRRQGVSMCQRGEGFVKVKQLKLLDTSTAAVDMSLSLKECEQECLRNCICTAYSSANESIGEYGCLKWYGDLVDTRAFSDSGQDLYLRVDEIDLARYRKRSTLVKKVIVATVSVSALVLLLLGSLMYYLLLKRKRADRRGRNTLVSVTTSSTYLDDLKDLDSQGVKNDPPLIDFGTVAAATSKFSSVNELGQGGFGSEYKGVINNETEIAVKRLSKCFGQGNEEFKNEVRLIAKLQYRNLVKILGCCIEEDEKLLIYEYLPNKSLDSFLFVGTWPQALQGWFSIKSNVYSYGDLLLEIITGQRNNGCYQMNPFCNLIGHGWKVWKEGKFMDIVDKSMDKTYSEEMVLRCIQIGLLCVQRYASDRPTMSKVVFMLGNADVVLSFPKQPAFIDESDNNV